MPMVQVILVVLLTLLVASGVVLKSATKKLEESQRAHLTCVQDLALADEKILEQNDKVLEALAKAAASKSSADTRVEVIYRDLPVLIERDVSSPATAQELNQWMRNLL